MTLDQMIAKLQAYKESGWAGETEVVGDPDQGDYPSDVRIRTAQIKSSEWSDDKDAQKVIVINAKY